MSILSLLCYFIQIISFIYWYTHRRDTGRELSSFREQAPIVSALERDQKGFDRNPFTTGNSDQKKNNAY